MESFEKFPRPWRVEETEAAYIVKDAANVVVGRVEAGASMTRDEARAIADGMVSSADVLASASEMKQQAKA